MEWLSDRMVKVVWRSVDPNEAIIEYFINYTINNQQVPTLPPYEYSVTLAYINVSDVGSYSFTIVAGINASDGLHYGIPATVTGNCM